MSLKRLNRNFESIVYGSKKFSIDKHGVIVQDDNGGTGLKWLYDNWEKIKFPRNDSSARNHRVDMLVNNKKDVLFLNKWVVIPAFYRDVNLHSADGNPKVPEINDLYSKIIRNTNMLAESNDTDFIISSITGQTQDLLVDVYNLIKAKIEKKNGYIHKFLMGKSIDYCSRVLITATPYTANSPSDQHMDFYHTGVPLSHVCAEFTPFILFWLKRWFKRNIENHKNSISIINSSGEEVTIKLDNPEAYYNEDRLESRLSQFIKTPATRFDPVELPVSKDEMQRVGMKTAASARFVGYKASRDSTMEQPENKIVRSLTWTDLLYMAAVDVTADKHVILTRYPYLDYNGSYISKIFIISTRDTQPMLINGQLYETYPVINTKLPKEDMDSVFRDTVNIAPMYLKVMDADHDGDQITCKGVFSQEANEECSRILMSKPNLLSLLGSGLRGVGNEASQTLYSMTKFH
jgi:DNA-directed RNA polymerase beta' subunit